MVKYLVKQNEKQQIQIINVLIDYYFTYGINNNKNASDLNNINALNDQKIFNFREARKFLVYEAKK